MAIECDRLEAVALCARDLEQAVHGAECSDLSLLSGSLDGERELQRAAAGLVHDHARAKRMLRLAVERFGVRRAGLARTGTCWYGNRPRATGRQAGLDLGA